MSMHAQQTHTVPEQTARAARTIFADGNPVMGMLDVLHMIVQDGDFADLFATRREPAESPARLALATLLQFIEGLTDCQTAEAVRSRIDWC